VDWHVFRWWWGVYTQGDGAGVTGGQNGEGAALCKLMVSNRIRKRSVKLEQLRTIARHHHRHAKRNRDITRAPKHSAHWVYVTSSNTWPARRPFGDGAPRQFVMCGHHKGLHRPGSGRGLFRPSSTIATGLALGERGREFGPSQEWPRSCGWFGEVRCAARPFVIGGIDGSR